MTDVPLEPYEPPHDRVVQLEEFRVRSGRTPIALKKQVCSHDRLLICDTERRVYCEDCQSEVDAFTALRRFHLQWGRLQGDLDHRRKQLDDDLAANLNRKAAKQMDRIWSGKMLPMCPHCQQGLKPEAFVNGGLGTVSREYADAQARRTKKEK